MTSPGVWNTHSRVENKYDAEGFVGLYDPDDPAQTQSILDRVTRYYKSIGYEIKFTIGVFDKQITYVLTELVEDERYDGIIQQEVRFNVLPIRPGQLIWTSYHTGLTIGVNLADLVTLSNPGERVEDPDQLELDLGL